VSLLANAARPDVLAADEPQPVDALVVGQHLPVLGHGGFPHGPREKIKVYPCRRRMAIDAIIGRMG